MEHFFCTPAEILGITAQKGITKTENPAWKQLLLSFAAGGFVGFACSGSNMASFGLLANPDTYGLGRFVLGAVFPVGLMMILIAGGELFTGNSLIIIPVLQKKVSMFSMLKNWCMVYIGNFSGAVFIAFMVVYSGQLGSGEYLLGGVTIKAAWSKLQFGFLQAVVLGILCNWLVCTAVWMCAAAKNIAGVIVAAFFPIFLFAITGFEHCIANMYYVPAGIAAQTIPAYAAASGLTADQLSFLTWPHFFINNLVPVTIGNIIGGSVFVGCLYLLCYGAEQKLKT